MIVEKITQLELWGLLEEAAVAPQDINWCQLWNSLDSALEDLELSEQLVVVAEALSSMTEIFKARSVDVFEEIEAVVSVSGPVMGDAHFASFVRQSMTLDFDQFVEAPVNNYRKPYERSDAITGLPSNNSIAEFVDKEVLLEALCSSEETSLDQQQESILNIAHSENVGAWVNTISNYIDNKGTVPISLVLHDLKGLAPIEVWLGLLLGGFSLKLKYSGTVFTNFQEECARFYSSEILVSKID